MSFYEDNRDEQNKFYTSLKWRKLRKQYLYEHPICERCAAIGIAAVAKHVHHIIELTESNYKDPNISLNPDNLEALCFDCHRKEHHDGVKKGHRDCGREFYFDSDGDLRLKP